MKWFILVLLILLLALSGWILWEIERRRREREAIEEQARLSEIDLFAHTLGAVLPEPGARETLTRLAGSASKLGSAVLVKRILDYHDEVTADGVVVGRCAPLGNGTGQWPYVAARHAARGYEPEWTITRTSVPLVLPERLRSRHLYVVGKSGSGKTTLIRNIALQDAADGAGLGVIAPEAELLTEELLPFIPEHRLDDVIYVNPADTARPVPINPLHVDDDEDLDLKLDETLTIFHRIIAEDGTGAPRMEAILRFSLLTLMSLPGTTLLDVRRLLDREDDTFRTRAVGRLENEEVRHFWTSTYAAFPRDAHLSLVTRLGRFLQPKVVRSILCQPGASLNVRAVMDAGRIIGVNLSDGILGEQNSQLLGQFIVAKFQTAAMSRANVPKESRRRFHLFVDEFQAFCGVAGTSYERILSRARKYNLSLILAHQQTGQISEPVMREILGNVGSLAVFRVGATDARRLGHELEGAHPGFDHRRLTSLAVGEAYCLFDRTLVLARTSPPPRGGLDSVRDEVIRRSRERYGVVPGTTARPRPGSPFDDLAVGDVFSR